MWKGGCGERDASMDGKMVWALGGVGCAGGGWEGADIFDSGRREEGQRYRDLYSVCVCSCSAQGVVFSSRHCVELRP